MPKRIETLRTFFSSVLAQALPDEASLELLVADGASTDGTREILNEYAVAYPWIRIVDNPRRIVSTGLNLLSAAYHSPLHVAALASTLPAEQDRQRQMLSRLFSSPV